MLWRLGLRLRTRWGELIMTHPQTPFGASISRFAGSRPLTQFLDPPLHGTYLEPRGICRELRHVSGTTCNIRELCQYVEQIRNEWEVGNMSGTT